jgi:SIR2-like domain
MADVEAGMSWGRLRQTYKKYGLVLVLGAGVSLDSGLPTWDDLLTRVAAAEADGGTGLLDELSRMRDKDVPLPVVASVLQQRCGGRTEFVDRVRRALYRDFEFFPDGVTKSNRRQLVNSVRKRNPTLRAVASLCASRESGKDRYSPNPRIRAVVTFNLDAVLQAYAYARYEKRLLRTIDRASAQAIPDRINVYHIHGYLRFDNKVGDPAKEAPDLVVLTESDYFDFFNDPTSLFNYTVLYLLREWPCLFIGLSMQDGNMRRLLHFSTKERSAALESEHRGAEPAAHRPLRHFAILKQSEWPQLVRALEDSLRALGTEILWVDDFDEIEPRLRDMYEAAGGRWDLVY